jgi:hypothetical protein
MVLQSVAYKSTLKLLESEQLTIIFFDSKFQGSYLICQGSSNDLSTFNIINLIISDNKLLKFHCNWQGVE